MATESIQEESTNQILYPQTCFILSAYGGFSHINIPGVVDWIMDNNQIATTLETGEIYLYYDGVYDKCGAPYLKNILETAFGDKLNYKWKPILNQHIVDEVLAKIKARTYQRMDNFNYGFDKITGAPLLNIQNGVLNLNTRELNPHSPEYLFTYKMPVNYDPQAQCPNYIEWRSSVIGHEFFPIIDEMMGSILYPDYRIQKAFMLLGPTRTGKGTLIRIIMEMVGDDNCSHVALQGLSDRFKIANLWGKKMNCFGDLPETMVMDVGYFKSITGQDTIEGEHKFQSSFNFENQAILLYSANRLPKVKNDDTAFLNRWEILKFDQSFLGHEDPAIEEQMKTPEELSGIFNLALDGLDRLVHNNWKINNPINSAEIYRRANRPIIAFLEDNYMAKDDTYVGKRELLEDYKVHAHQNGLSVPSSMIIFNKWIAANTTIPVSGGWKTINLKQGAQKEIEVWMGICKKL